MSNYYFVGTILPPLSFETEPEVDFRSLDSLLKDNLSQSDYQKTVAIRRFFDLLNLRALWTHEAMDLHGEMSAQEMEEALITTTNLPDYIFDFLAKFHSLQERLERAYFSFERNFRLVTTGFRAKKLHRDLITELRFEDLQEEFIKEMIAQNEGKEFTLPEEYEEIKNSYEKFGEEPLLLQRALDEYRFNFIDQLVDPSDTFSIERILAYMIQLIIVEKWFELDKAKGMQIVDTIVKEG